LGLSPARGAPFDWEWCSRHSAVLILLNFEVMSTSWAGKIELSPARGAHFET